MLKELEASFEQKIRNIQFLWSLNVQYSCDNIRELVNIRYLHCVYLRNIFPPTLVVLRRQTKP